MGYLIDSDFGLPTVTYLSMDSLASTVGSSQVLLYVERLASREIGVDLVTFEHDLDPALADRLSDLGVKWRPLPFGRYGPVGGLGRVFRAAWAIRGSVIVHARSDMAAASVMLAGINRWVWDVRSLWVDQKVASGVVQSGSLRHRIMSWVERQAAKRSGGVITLTESAIRELDRRYDAGVSPKAQVVTTCTDLSRFSVSQLPSLPFKILLAGTLNRYYDVNTMLELVTELRKRSDVEFVVASPSETDWEDELARVEVLRIAAEPSEMPGLVRSCHVGLSVCHDDAGISLCAAMPTKIGEFLASGRPVVVNPGLTDAASLVEQYQCGVVFGKSSPLGASIAADELEKLLVDPGTPERCRLLAEKHFGLEEGVDRLIQTYALVGNSR